MKAAPKPPLIERKQLMRRKLNDEFYGFCDPDGRFSWSKFLATIGQATALVVFWRDSDALIKNTESLIVVLAFVVTPDLLKKLISMKYGK